MNPSDPAAKPVSSAATVAAGHRPLYLGGRPPLLVRARAYRLLWVIAIAVFLIDQLSKLLIVARVPFDPMHSHGAGSDIEVIRGFFYIISTR